MEENIIHIPVRFNETDMMGIVHNSVYYIWFELARNFFAYNVLDLDFNHIKERGITAPVIHSECDYLHVVTYPQTVIVKCYYEMSESARLILHYEVFCQETNILVARGKTINVFLSKEGRLLINKPDFICRAEGFIANKAELMWHNGQ